MTSTQRETDENERKDQKDQSESAEEIFRQEVFSADRARIDRKDRSGIPNGLEKFGFPSSDEILRSTPRSASKSLDDSDVEFKNPYRDLSVPELRERLQVNAQAIAVARQRVETLEAQARKMTRDRQEMFDDSDMIHTKNFDHLNAVEQFRKEGWTPALQNKLYPVICERIAEAKGTGHFCAGGWDDVLTAVRMATTSGQRSEFVKGINQLLLKQGANIRISIVDCTPTNPISKFIIEGGSQDRNQIPFKDDWTLQLLNSAFDPQKFMNSIKSNTLKR